MGNPFFGGGGGDQPPPDGTSEMDRRVWEMQHPEQKQASPFFGMFPQQQQQASNRPSLLAGQRSPIQGLARSVPQGGDEGPVDFSNGMGGIFGEAEQEGRGLTVDALGLSRQAATGAAPSQAELMGQSFMDRAAREQQSAAAGARGPAAMALAQQQAAANTAAMQQQGAMQAQAGRAAEMATARGEYLGGTGLLRGQDQSRYGAELGRAAQNADRQNQYAMGTAGLAQGYNKQADQNQQYGAGLGAQGQQMLASSYDSSQAGNQARMSGNAQRDFEGKKLIFDKLANVGNQASSGASQGGNSSGSGGGGQAGSGASNPAGGAG